MQERDQLKTHIAKLHCRSKIVGSKALVVFVNPMIARDRWYFPHKFVQHIIGKHVVDDQMTEWLAGLKFRVQCLDAAWKFDLSFQQGNDRLPRTRGHVSRWFFGGFDDGFNNTSSCH